MANDLGLSVAQFAHAMTIIGVVKSRGLPPRAAVIAIETALVESGLRNYANSNMPESLNYPHDAVGSDHDSVGVFQQQPWWWNSNLDMGMDVQYQTNGFLNRLTSFDWQSMPTGQAAQSVQVSAYPDRYQQQEATAARIVAALWPQPAPIPDVEDDMKDYLVAFSNRMWVVRRDLSSRTGIHDSDTVTALSKTGQYISADWIDAQTMGNIPVAHP